MANSPAEGVKKVLKVRKAFKTNNHNIMERVRVDGRVCFDVKVAWARKIKFERVNVVVMYEPNVVFKDDPCNRERK